MIKYNNFIFYITIPNMEKYLSIIFIIKQKIKLRNRLKTINAIIKLQLEFQNIKIVTCEIKKNM